MDEAWKDFFTDYQTERAMNSSEVWRNYSITEMHRDVMKKKAELEAELDNENELMSAIDDFREKVATNPKLKSYLKRVAEFLEQYPELREKTDPNFINGLALLDLED